MNVVTEFVKFDDEDRGNIDYEGGEYPYGIHRAEKDHMFFLCYYTPQNQDNIVVPGEGNSKRFKFSSLRILILRLCLVSPRRSSQNKLTNLIQRHLRNWRLTWRWKPIAAGWGGGVSPALICPASYLRHCDKTPTRLQVLPTILFRYENTSRPATEAIAGLDRRHACKVDTSSTSQACRR